MRKRSIVGQAAVLLGLGLLASLVMGPGRGAPRPAAAQALTTAACADNLHRLKLAVDQYTQDNDEVFPPMQDAPAFQAALLPYVKDPAAFRCPDTGLPYTPNTALSQRSYPSITGDLDAVEVVRDSATHADGLTTIVFLDGHVEHGGVEVGDPLVILTGREKDLASAIAAYTQDHAQIFPPMHTPQELQAAVFPYARSRRIFNAPDGQPFVPTAALSGVSLASVADPSAVVLLQDTGPYLDGVPTLAFVDGHLERGGIEYGDPNVIVRNRARQLSLAMMQFVLDNNEIFPPMHTPQEFQAAIFPYLHNRRAFSNTNGGAFLPNTALSGVSLASIADPASTVLFQDTLPYTGGTPTTAYIDWHVTHVALPPSTHVLWANVSGQVSLWNYDTATGAYGYLNYGPFAGWSAAAVADGPDGRTRVLWTTADGTMSLWSLDNATGVYTHHEFGPYSGWTAGSLSVGLDNTTHVLWTNTSGQLSLWNCDALAGTYGYVNYGPFGGWSARSLADGGTDGKTRVLWTRADGTTSLWSLDTTSAVYTHHEFGPYPGWTANALSVGKDNRTHVLWTNTDGRLSLWNCDALAGTFGYLNYGPFGGWTAKSLADGGTDGKTRVLWTTAAGQASLWSLDNSAGVYAHHEFGAYAGWTAAVVSAGP